MSIHWTRSGLVVSLLHVTRLAHTLARYWTYIKWEITASTVMWKARQLSKACRTCQFECTCPWSWCVVKQFRCCLESRWCLCWCVRKGTNTCRCQLRWLCGVPNILLYPRKVASAYSSPSRSSIIPFGKRSLYYDRL
jgi:hypothetical protein